jgi:hypothetical protein
MDAYWKAAPERAMKIQEVILRAMAKKISWWQAAEILGFSDRHLRRIRERYEQFGYESLFDKRRSQPSPKRVPYATVEQVLALYREKYFDLNVRHFHEKLGSIELGDVVLAQKTTPPPHTARPVSRELPVDPDRDLRWGFPCYLWSPMRTCRRHYPGRCNGACSLVGLHCQRPSP